MNNEPVAVVFAEHWLGGEYQTIKPTKGNLPLQTKLYTHPPLRELTDEEIMAVWDGLLNSDKVLFARNLFKKAREK